METWWCLRCCIINTNGVFGMSSVRKMGGADVPSMSRNIPAVSWVLQFSWWLLSLSLLAFLLLSQNYSGGWLRMSRVVPGVVKLHVCSNFKNEHRLWWMEVCRASMKWPFSTFSSYTQLWCRVLARSSSGYSIRSYSTVGWASWLWHRFSRYVVFAIRFHQALLSPYNTLWVFLSSGPYARTCISERSLSLIRRQLSSSSRRERATSLRLHECNWSYRPA